MTNAESTTASQLTIIDTRESDDHLFTDRPSSILSKITHEGPEVGDSTTLGTDYQLSSTGSEGEGQSEGQGTEPASEVTATSSTLLLHTLPHELLLHILAFLDVPDLLAVSRTTHDLRPLPLDPILHRQRLASIPYLLSSYLSRRPPLASLKPPRSTIYLTSTASAARRVSRELISSRLRRRLTRRPEIADLVSRNVLPSECCAFLFYSSRSSVKQSGHSHRQSTSIDHDATQSKPAEPTGGPRNVISETPPDLIPLKERFLRTSFSSSLDSEDRIPGSISPTLVHAKRRIERERIKDRIRSWVENRGRQELERRLRAEEEESKHSVAGLIRRFRVGGREADATVATSTSGGSMPMLAEETAGEISDGVRARRRPATERWGRGAVKWAERRKRDPTRAHVLGLRRFWESVGNAER